MGGARSHTRVRMGAAHLGTLYLGRLYQGQRSVCSVVFSNLTMKRGPEWDANLMFVTWWQKKTYLTQSTQLYCNWKLTMGQTVWQKLTEPIHIIVMFIYFLYTCISIYYNNTGIPCVFVTSEFSGTGCPNDTPFSPAWRASSGELQRLHLESTGRVLWERKPLELFRC